MEKVVKILRADPFELSQSDFGYVQLIKFIGMEGDAVLSCDEVAEEGAQIQKIFVHGFWGAALNGQLIGCEFLNDGGKLLDGYEI
jgi:hypothetical protein